MKENEPRREQIVILGAGFAGITALLKLRRLLRGAGLLGRYRLILVNKTDYQLYTPALYETPAIPRQSGNIAGLKASIAIPIDDILHYHPGIEFIGEEIIGLDPERRMVRLARSGELPYRFLVIALGAETNYFDIPGLQEYSLPLKTFEDAIVLRNRVGVLVTGGTQPIADIVIGGAGATGVEFAAELIRSLQRLARNQRGMSPVSVTLAEGGPSILNGFSSPVVARAERRLRKLGVIVKTGAVITEVLPSVAILKDGSRLPYDLFVWAGGVRPMKTLTKCNVTLDRKGGIAVNEFLESCTGVYAVGDCMSFIHPETQKPLPGNAVVAETSGIHAAKNIFAEITGEPRTPFRPRARYPFILAVGGKYAIADLVAFRFAGFSGWLVKQLVELKYLLSIVSAPQAFRITLRWLFFSTRND